MSGHIVDKKWGEIFHPDGRSKANSRMRDVTIKQNLNPLWVLNRVRQSETSGGRGMKKHLINLQDKDFTAREDHPISPSVYMRYVRGFFNYIQTEYEPFMYLESENLL